MKKHYFRTRTTDFLSVGLEMQDTEQFCYDRTEN